MYKITEKVALNPTVTKMVIEAPLIAKKAKPGQFIIVRPFEDSERIPLTVAGYDREKGTVDIIFQIVGGTTMELNSLNAGDCVHDFVGPLGRATETEGLKKVCVVGGGVGCAIALPIAKELVEHIGGSISFVSQQGKGTTFTIVLPFLPDPDSAAPAAPVPVEELPSIAGARVLLAEDNETNAEIAVSILEEVHGAHVEVAHNGQEAVDMFSAHPAGYYDFILMDVQMPVMDGRTAARTIRALPRPDAKTELIFALSADAFLEDERQSVEAGMNGHFSKPVNYDKLRRCVGTFFKSREDV